MLVTFHQAFGNVTSHIPDFSISDKAPHPGPAALRSYVRVHFVTRTLVGEGHVFFQFQRDASARQVFSPSVLLFVNRYAVQNHNLLNSHRRAREDIREVRVGPPIRV